MRIDVSNEQPSALPRATLSRHGASVCAALDQLDVGAAQVTPDGRWVTVNRRFQAVTDRTTREIFETTLTDLLQIDAALLASATAAACSVHSRVGRKDGRLTWIKVGLAPVRDPTTDHLGSLLVVVDEIPEGEGGDEGLSPRHAAGKLLNAIEAERSHIARELHDDIGQSLAVMVVQFRRAGQPISGTVDRQHPDIAELGTRLEAIASRVGQLSHRLHSPRLEYFGLEPAARNACEEFTDGNVTDVRCTCTDVPAQLDGDIGLCVLRVLQEALHNIAKHSRAKHVTVELTGGADVLTLAVVDDGVGFDVAEANLAEGIGLISMRERVRFVGGAFSLSSAPGHGARIEARVPVRSGNP